MKLPFFNLQILDFTELDRQIVKLGELRDSYHAANRAYYGDYLAVLLND